jgi:NADH-quinone oxidoreductase subunit I
MPINPSDLKWIQSPKMGLFEQLYLPAIVEGLGTTVRHTVGVLFGKGSLTQQYPEEQPRLPANYRGVHRLNRDEQGRVKCVACYMCSTACPAHCIDIVAAPSPWPDREKYPETFVIDELRCIYCGMCEQACPVDAIELTTLFDLTGLSREEMMFDKEKLLGVFDQTVKTGTDPVRTRAGRLGVASELPLDTGLTASSTAQS